MGALVAGGAAFWAFRGDANDSGKSLEARAMPQQEKPRESVSNWSQTHECRPREVLRPSSAGEVQEILQKAHENGDKIRIMGSGLSPNGIAFSKEKLLTIENMNEVISVDKGSKQVTVQCGTLVGEILEYLKEHDLTLQNLASINQQQLGGFIQVGAHGTGAAIPPVEEQIVALEIATPAMGTLKLKRGDELFDMVKCGLGCFGVVTQITIQCVDAHRLKEDTFVLPQPKINAAHVDTLHKYRHARYMWIPYTGHAVVVQSNPTKDPLSGDESVSTKEHARRVAPMTSLLQTLLQKTSQVVPKNLDAMGFGELRDWLLRAGPGPLDPEHVKEANKAELEFWKRSEARGVVNDSFDVLAFDCGGQQLVHEVVLPCGTVEKPDGRDLEFIDAILKRIEKLNIAAPAPIEQRWSCGSSAPMSPVHVSSDSPHKPHDSLFSWVGIIMYLPTQDPAERKAIEDAFYDYKQVVEKINEEGDFKAVTHWAKIEVPRTDEVVEQERKKLAKRYPLKAFEELRSKVDPKRVLTNDLIDTLLS